MRVNKWLFGLILFGSITLIFNVLDAREWLNYPEQPQREETIGQNMPQAPEFMQSDALRRMDPSTGTVPSERLWTALKQVQHRNTLEMTRNSARSRSLGRDEGLLDYTWQPIDDRFASLAVTQIVHDPTDPMVYYFCTGEGWFNADAVRGAGVWKSINAGQDWIQLPSTDTSAFWYCQDMLVHPNTGDVYVATRSAGLQRSVDGGLTWQQVLGSGNGSSRNSICDLELTADGGIFAGIGIFDTDGLYYSPSGDAGSWTKQTNGFPGSGIWRVEVATAPSNALVAYAIPMSTDGLIDAVYRTNDGGSTWNTVNNPGGNRNFAASQAWYDLTLAVDPNDENVVVTGGLDSWRSRDGGDSWQKLSSGRPDTLLTRYMHVDQHGIFFVNSDTVYFTNDGGIYRCDNFRDDVPILYERNLGYNVTQYYAADIAPEAGDFRVLGGTQDNGSQISLSEGLSRFKPVSGADGSFCRFDHSNGNQFYTSKQFEPIYRFKNGGFELPDTLDNPLVSNNNLQFINAFEMDPNDPELLYQASSRGLQRLREASSTNPDQWEQASKNIGVITAIGISTVPPNIVFMGRNAGNAELIRLEDAHVSNLLNAGQPTDPNNNIPDAPVFGSLTVSSIAVDTADANHVLVTYSNYGVSSVWESQDALASAPTWISVEGDLPDIPVNWSWIHPSNPQVAYLATDLGIWYTDTLQGTNTHWKLSTNFPTVRTDMIRYRKSDGTLVAATHGRGIFTAKADPLARQNNLSWQERGPTNVGGRTRTLMVDPNDPSGETVWAGSVSGGLWWTRGISAVGIPTVVGQSNIQWSATPNPFSQTLKLQLSLGSPVEGAVTILDISGRQIAELATGSWGAGEQYFIWKPSSKTPPGLYFGLLTTKNEQKVVKFFYQP